MAKTYRDVAIEQMILTVKEAMSRTIDWWGELPAPRMSQSTGFVFNWRRQSIPSTL